MTNEAFYSFTCGSKLFRDETLNVVVTNVMMESMIYAKFNGRKVHEM